MRRFQQSDRENPPSRRRTSGAIQHEQRPRSRSRSRNRSHSRPRNYPITTKNEDLTSSPSQHYNSNNQEDLDNEMMSFRDFILSQRDDDADPTALVEMYEKYKDEFAARNACKFYMNRKECGYMIEHYHPDSLHRFYLKYHDGALRRAGAFYKLLANDGFAKLHLRAETLRSGGDLLQQQKTVQLDITSHKYDTPPYFLTYRMHSLRLSQIPFDISTWDISDLIESIGVIGVIDVCISPVSPTDMNGREGYIIFDTSEHAQEGCTSLYRQRVKDSYALHPIVEYPKSYSVNITPAIMCRPGRIQRDLILSGSLIRKYDEEYGIQDVDNYLSEDKIMTSSSSLDDVKRKHPLLDRRYEDGNHDSNDTLSSDEHQLDLQIYYLRKIHHCCYYSGKKFSNESELLNSCGHGFLRPSLPPVIELDTNDDDQKSDNLDIFGDEETEKNNKWLLSLTNRLSNLLENRYSVSSPVNEDHPEVAQQWTEFCDNTTLKVDDERWRCGICRKLFRGPTYVHKHIKNKHATSLHQIIKEIADKKMKNNYMNDAHKVFAFTRDLQAPPVSPHLSYQPRRRSERDDHQSSNQSRRTAHGGGMHSSQFFDGSRTSNSTSTNIKDRFDRVAFGFRDLDAPPPAALGVSVGQFRAAVRYDDL